MIHIADHRPDPSWSTRFYMWGTRAHRYLLSPVTLAIAIAGGLAGFVLSLAAGTALIWAMLALVAAAIALVVHVARHRDLRAVRPQWWTALALASFFNQVALVAPSLYVTVATAAILAALMPAILHGLGWLFFALSPATV